jgi:type II secretory pathway predicted ATPase ExeA
MAPTIAEAVAHLKRTRPRVKDGAIAVLATRILREQASTLPGEGVSRPLVNMVRRGKAKAKHGMKVWAVWQALRQLGLVPAVPLEVAGWTTRSKYYAKRTTRASPRAAAGLQRDDIKEVPVLTATILRWWGFDPNRNPVFDEMRGDKDMWWGRQHTEAKSVLLDAAARSQFVLLAGRRGAGKTLVGRQAREELRQDDNVVLIEPSPVMSGVMTVNHLVTAIVQGIKRFREQRDEVYAVARDPMRRTLAMTYLLRELRRDGRRSVLWIDEAHDLQADTFLSLKRLLDDVDGAGRRLLSIILIGQHPNLAYNPRQRDLSEVMGRLQTYTLRPMHDEIADYLRHKIDRAGGKVSEVITPTALRALASRCPFPLDANVNLARLLIEGYEWKVKPIDRDRVTGVLEALEVEPSSDERERAAR